MEWLQPSVGQRETQSEPVICRWRYVRRSRGACRRIIANQDSVFHATGISLMPPTGGVRILSVSAGRIGPTHEAISRSQSTACIWSPVFGTSEGLHCGSLGGPGSPTPTTDTARERAHATALHQAQWVEDRTPSYWSTSFEGQSSTTIAIATLIRASNAERTFPRAGSTA